MAEYLVHTDVLIDHLRGARKFEPGPDDVSCSVVTRCELFAGRSTDEAVVAALLATLRELEVDRTVAERAGRIRRASAISIPDALIAATALEHRLALFTRNSKHFEPVAELTLHVATVSAPSASDSATSTE